jgi:hypothetical protein
MRRRRVRVDWRNISGGLLDRPDLGIPRFDGFDVGGRVSFSREHEHRRFLGK